MSAQANCPACGVTVTFDISSSLAVVCASCRSVVARTDRALESLGKVAELSESRSPLQLGLRGQYQGHSFRLVGRAQVKHLAGGVWDEWYAAFGDGRWGWLAEAMGRFFLTFAAGFPKDARPLEFGRLELGSRPPALGGTLVVAEKGIGECTAAEGELPYRLVPGARYPYADLSGPNGQFGTLDYSGNEPALYLGQEATLTDLGLAGAAAKAESVKAVRAAKVACPRCGGALELRAPDRTERVGCPYCGSLLDVNQGSLAYLKTLSPSRHKPLLPLGSSAEFEGAPFTVIGFLVRACHIESTWYPWDEYLLYHPQLGYRWLVCSDGHWTFGQAIAPADVEADADGSSSRSPARYRGQTFKRFQDAPARVEFVRGEFYWKIEAGEAVESSDFVHAPRILSREIARYEVPKEWEQKEPDRTLGEVSWALGEYIPVAAIRRKFPQTQIPDPRGVGPCQPFPHRGVYRWWGWLSLAAALLIAAVAVISPRREVLRRTFQFPPLDRNEGTQVLFAEPFELRGTENIHVEGQAAVDNSWFFVHGELVLSGQESAQTAFALPIEYYHGVEGGESWSEGGNSADEFLTAPEAGLYALRLEASWGQWQSPAALALCIRQGVPHLLYAVLLLAALSLIPVVVLLRELSFEGRRWQESMYSGGSDD
jgi:hypothetical protein